MLDLCAYRIFSFACNLFELVGIVVSFRVGFPLCQQKQRCGLLGLLKVAIYNSTLKCHFCLFSQSEHDRAVNDLNKNLNEVECGLSDAEHKRPVYDEKDSVSLETIIIQLKEQKVSRVFF